MPVVRQPGLSVRERIAAIEKKVYVVGRPTENTVIRARYEPDVRGVNRFRHFHTPLILNDEKTKNKQQAETTHLPMLVNVSQTVINDNSNSENGMEKGTRQKKNSRMLPQLANVETMRQKDSEKEDCESYDTVKPGQKSSSESERSMKMGYLGSRLKEHSAVHNKSSGPKRTFASLGQRQNGVILNRPTDNHLDVALPQRSKSAQDIDDRNEIDFEPDTELSSVRNSKDTATQTNKNQFSTTSVEFLNCVRSTQTESLPVILNSRRKSDARPSLQEIEEREALLEVIEDALNQTFDRYSRVRTSQIIANSARKQAQIWKDAKDFLGGHLFPCAIQLANKSTTKSKTAAEIVASIRILP